MKYYIVGLEAKEPYLIGPACNILWVRMVEAQRHPLFGDRAERTLALTLTDSEFRDWVRWFEEKMRTHIPIDEQDIELYKMERVL